MLFKEKFSNWPDKLPIATQAAVVKGRVANINKDEKVDVLKMHEYKPPAPRVVEGTEPKLQSTPRRREERGREERAEGRMYLFWSS